MTECQGCGAWNERRRTLCVLCGTPLAETDEWDAAVGIVNGIEIGDKLKNSESKKQTNR